jgi:hypothetical protein
MNKLLLFICVIFLTSCATQDVFDAEKADTYLMSHSERPVYIKEALSVGKLAKGMNEEEVDICWGKPGRIEERSMPDHESIIWRYFENLIVGRGPKNSMIKKRLSKEVEFRNGRVIAWREFNSPS